jgi:LysW-gamma-L-lysine carboxypeptidase
VAAELRGLSVDLAAPVDVEVLSEESPVHASRATPLARAFQRAVRSQGGSPVFKVKTGTSDMNVLGPAWGCPILAYGPGDSRYDHTPDERLDLREYGRSIAVLREALTSLADETARRTEPTGRTIEAR